MRQNNAPGNTRTAVPSFLQTQEIVIEIHDCAEKMKLRLVVFCDNDFSKPLTRQTVLDTLSHIQRHDFVCLALQKTSLFRTPKKAARHSVMWWSFYNGKLGATSQHLITGERYEECGSILSCVAYALGRQ